MPIPMMCLCFLVRRKADGQPQVLLGRKLRGFGAGHIVGLGGKLEPGEDARAAAVREAAEEAGVAIEPTDLEQRAVITFLFPTKPGWDQRATVFVTERWAGEPAQTPEISPGWYDVDAPPFDEMWADARHWLPLVLAGWHLTARFTFRQDLHTPATIDVEVDPEDTRSLQEC